jgi:hypothetical protein
MQDMVGDTPAQMSGGFITKLPGKNFRSNGYKGSPTRHGSGRPRALGRGSRANASAAKEVGSILLGSGIGLFF